jgi:nucleoside-diphosphate-sugar epimerase
MSSLSKIGPTGPGASIPQGGGLSQNQGFTNVRDGGYNIDVRELPRKDLRFPSLLLVNGVCDPPQRGVLARPRLGKPRLLIVGCGDIGLRIVACLRGRFRVFGAVRRQTSADAVRRAGATPLRIDLDQYSSLARLKNLATRVLVLAPTTAAGHQDHRSRHLLRALRPAPGGRLVYLSTTGVYGDRRGAWTDETVTPQPASDRAIRRLDAERRLRFSGWHAAILRVPGIYGPTRLPLARLRNAVPVPLPEQDVMTNHIHAEDLARVSTAALFRAAPTRLYNAVDDSRLSLGDYLDRVADHAGLARPPRTGWEQLRQAAGPLRMSFLEESRRLRNVRLKRELRVRLRYPDVDAGLAAMAAVIQVS